MAFSDKKPQSNLEVQTDRLVSASIQDSNTYQYFLSEHVFLFVIVKCLTLQALPRRQTGVAVLIVLQSLPGMSLIRYIHYSGWRAFRWKRGLDTDDSGGVMSFIICHVFILCKGALPQSTDSPHETMMQTDLRQAIKASSLSQVNNLNYIGWIWHDVQMYVQAAALLFQ